ncbi:MAG: histidine kinase [Rickettsiales bacterium]|nr:MAG: histidine kinase [Rickettsiales bacterium]
MLTQIWKNLSSYKLSNNAIYALISVISTSLVITLFTYADFFFNNPDPLYILGFLLATLVLILCFSIIVVNNRVSSTFSFRKGGKKRVSKLRKRIIIAFSIGATLPTIIIAVFSTYFFNFGIEAWFSQKVSNVLDQSIIVGESYIEEHVMQLRETAISVSNDLSEMCYDLIRDPESFSKVINAQAEMRSLDEAMVFQKDTQTILAQTKLSFALSFTTIPVHLITRADKGGIVPIPAGSTKIRALIKLRGFNDAYLLIGRFVDSKIIDHIDKTNGAAEEYFRVKRQISELQIKFSMVFIIVSLILLVAATIWGRAFAERIVKPIRELVIAAERVKNGDLSTQVPMEGLKKDEIKVLSAAFNQMVNQINRQQKDLVIAQRALAWSDVARRVAHEIKNPLTPIQLSADRLLKKFAGEVSDPESFTKYVKNIIRHSNDIKSIVSEFVDFARLPTPSFAKCKIVSMISNLVESRKLINDLISYSFVSDTEEFELVCDISQINRVMVNLLQNAEEAFGEQEKALGERTSGPKEQTFQLEGQTSKSEEQKTDMQISVTLSASEDQFLIIIDDNGAGFSDKLLTSAKEAYVTTKSNGTGLGLAIVDRIVIDHFGEVALSNNTHGGARITLTFSVKELTLKLK